MPTFEEALRANLFGLNDAFKAADAELHSEVASAAQALGRLGDGIATLELVPTSESPGGAFYDLHLRGGANFRTVLAKFSVPARGYPIRVTLDPLSTQPRDLKNGQEIAALLAEMAANPDSALVQHLAFLLRRKQ